MRACDEGYPKLRNLEPLSLKLLSFPTGDDILVVEAVEIAEVSSQDSG